MDRRACKPSSATFAGQAAASAASHMTRHGEPFDEERTCSCIERSVIWDNIRFLVSGTDVFKKVDL